MNEQKSQEQMVVEMYEALVGTLDKPGFIDETRYERSKTNLRVSVLERAKKAGIGFIVSILTLAIGNIFL